MKKIIKLYLTLACVFLLAIGCNKNDINKLSIISAIGIDKSETGFEVTFQIVNDYVLGQQRKIDIAPVSVRTIKGATVFETMAKTSNYITEKFFLYHFRILAFGEDIAREGIQPFLNAFLNYRQTQHNYNIIVIDGGKAKDALKIQSSLDLIPGIALDEKIRNSKELYSLGSTINLDQVLSDIAIKGSHFVLTSVKVEGDAEKGTEGESSKSIDPDAYFVVSNLAVFKEDKLLGYLTEKESLGYQYIMNNIKNSIVPVVLDDESVLTIAVQKSKAKVKAFIDNDKPRIKITCRVRCSVYEDMSGMTKFTSEYMNEVIKKTEYEITKMMSDSVKRTQTEFNSDIFHFSEAIHRRYPKFWKQIIDRYDEIYPEMDVQIEVKMELDRVR